MWMDRQSNPRNRRAPRDHKVVGCRSVPIIVTYVTYLLSRLLPVFMQSMWGVGLRW